jgi:ankyrin repeat protein
MVCFLGMGEPPWHPDGEGIIATNKRAQGETVLYRHFSYRHVVSLCSIAIAVLGAAPAARAADSERCLELGRRFELAKPQITAIEVSLTLFAAVDSNCIALTTELLDYGASVDARDRLGARPLSHAAKSGHLGMVDLLLARGAPINARNLAGATALYFAAEGGHTPIAQRLIERGADVKLTGRSGISPVSAAAYVGNDAIVEALLAGGGDEHASDETGKPPIVYAAAGARLDIVKRLLARNIDVNARYPNDLTLLMWASGPDEQAPEAQAIKVVSYLLDAGAHIDDRDDRGRTALMIAAEGGHAEIANLLLARGADQSLKDKAGKRAADLTVLSSLRERLTPP